MPLCLAKCLVLVLVSDGSFQTPGFDRANGVLPLDHEVRSGAFLYAEHCRLMMGNGIVFGLTENTAFYFLLLMVTRFVLSGLD